MTSDGAGSDPSVVVGRLEDAMLQLYFARRPFAAGQLGIRWGRGAMPPVGQDASDDLIGGFQRVRADLRAALAADLSDRDRMTCRLMEEICGYEIASLQIGWHRFTVSPLPEAGLAAQTLVFLPYATLSGTDDVDAFLLTCAGIDDTLARGTAELALGRGRGQLPVRRLVQRSIEQIQLYLDTPVDRDPFLLAVSAPGAPVSSGQIRGLRRVVVDRIRPAFARYADDLRGTVLGSARDDDHPGLDWIPQGAAAYSAMVAEHTTLPETAEHWHGVGRDLVRDLQQQAVAIGRDLGWIGSFDDIRDRMRADPALRYRDAEQMLATAGSAMDRAHAAVPTWITDLPSADCMVRPMHHLEAPNGVLGHYETAPLDRSGPAVYWLNTADPTSRPAFEAEALAFHESIPGHHLEIATSQELTIGSEFRRLVQIVPYTEGWALYMERFADEIGLYSDDVARLGMISFGLWRAGRLVVDSGLHALRWTRRQAVDYLWDNTILTRTNISNEIDRYIAHPGSALGYMVGQLAIQQLRAAAVPDPSSAPDVRRFHHGLLQQGPLTLGLLSSVTGVQLAI